VIHNIQLNQQEVQGGALSSHATVDLSHLVDGLLSFLRFDLLALNLHGGGLGRLERVDQLNVGQDGLWVSV
jgi:hypothetical protein